MFQYIKKLFIKDKIVPSLNELDELYANTVVFLPVSVRLDYCVCLRERCKMDLKLIKSTNEKKRLLNIIQAVDREIRILKSNN